MPNNNSKVAVHNFYFETGLYKKVKFSEIDDTSKHKFLKNYIDGDLDGFSPHLKEQTTYYVTSDYSFTTRDSKIMGNVYVYKEDIFKPGIYKVCLKCKRSQYGNLVFFLEISNDYIQKVGQFPSYTDLNKVEKVIENNLTKIDLENYKKAIALFDHGFSVGAYCYLRRIFENMVLQTFEDNKDKLAISFEDFKILPMSKKLDEVKSYLPSILSEFPGFYNIVSAGIHELPEEKCSEYFITLKSVLDFIIKDSNRQKQEKIDREKLSLDMQKITSAIK